MFELGRVRIRGGGQAFYSVTKRDYFNKNTYTKISMHNALEKVFVHIYMFFISIIIFDIMLDWKQNSAPQVKML